MKNTDIETLDKLIALVRNNEMPISFVEKTIEEFEISEIKAGKEFNLAVDYNRTLEEMVLAPKFYKSFWNGKLGKDRWKRINDYSTRMPKLKSDKIVTIKAKVFNFYDKKNVYNLPTYNQAKEMVIKEGYELGTQEELLALAEAHPDLQIDFSIAALGSVVKVVDPYNKNKIDTCYPYIYFSWESGFRGFWVFTYNGENALQGPDQRHCMCLLGTKVVTC